MVFFFHKTCCLCGLIGPGILDDQAHTQCNHHFLLSVSLWMWLQSLDRGFTDYYPHSPRLDDSFGSSHWNHLRHYLGHLSCMPRFNHSLWSYTGLPSLSGQTSPPESPPLQCGCLWAWWGEVLDVPRSLPRWGRESWPGPAWSVGTVGTCAWFHLPHSVSLGAGVLSPCFQISWPR